ncbi:MAG: 50S ribosomal protein L11 methyltransferase [Fimbriimonadaceae bacterium]|nr:50S ribosomal protein L11 methyltransferase [Fimbriimonadaceae bacterium]
MTVWIEIKAVLDSAPEDWAILADAFDRFGCPATIIGENPPSISAYLVSVAGTSAQVEALSRELRSLGAREIITSEVNEEDWAEAWKKHFKPRRVGKRFVVRPTWEEFEFQPGDIDIVLDPGQAFGTGDHPTTRMCLELLEAEQVDGSRVLDLGCGSGILGIGALKLGAQCVLAADIDPISAEVTAQNAEINNVVLDVVCGDGFEHPSSQQPWDLILSNIISATLIRLTPQAWAHLRPGGNWIVSGIIRENWLAVLEMAERGGFQLVRKLDKGEWVGATLQKPRVM